MYPVLYLLPIRNISSPIQSYSQLYCGLVDKVGIEPTCLSRPRRNQTAQAITLLYPF